MAALALSEEWRQTKDRIAKGTPQYNLPGDSSTTTPTPVVEAANSLNSSWILGVSFFGIFFLLIVVVYYALKWRKKPASAAKKKE